MATPLAPILIAICPRHLCVIPTHGACVDCLRENRDTGVPKDLYAGVTCAEEAAVTRAYYRGVSDGEASRLLHVCTCELITGGHRVTRPGCPTHSGFEFR
jgi:hypothetical protein